jgi:hypothetical protein
MAGNGNSGQRKDRLFRDAIMMELKIRDAGEDLKTLRQIASDVIEDALSTKPEESYRRAAAIAMLADRIDGKPLQQQDINVNENVTYVALMPQRHGNMDTWLTNSSQETKALTKQ